MAIDPSSLQMLGMILERRDRKDEMSAQHGHDITMMGLQSEQRSLESEISWNREREARLTDQVMNLQSQLDAFGVEYDQFGSDDQSADMLNRMGSSMTEQIESLRDITNMKEQELRGLRTASNLFSRGADVAAGLFPEFEFTDDGVPVLADNEYAGLVGALNQGGQEFEEMAMNVLGDERLRQASTEERNAFLQGVRNTLIDRTERRESERFAIETATFDLNREMAALEMQSMRQANEMNQQQNYKSNLEFVQNQAQYYREIAKSYIADSISPTTMEFAAYLGDASRSARNEYADKVEEVHQTLAGGAQGYAAVFSDQMKSMIAEDITGEDRQKIEDRIDSYFANFAGHFTKVGTDFVSSLATAPDNVFTNVTSALTEFEKAIEESGGIYNAIRDNNLTPDTFATVLAYTNNPFIFTSWDAGFDIAQQASRATQMSRHYAEADPNQNIVRLNERVSDSFNNNAMEELSKFTMNSEIASIHSSLANTAEGVKSLEEKLQDPGSLERLSLQAATEGIPSAVRTGVEENLPFLSDFVKAGGSPLIQLTQALSKLSSEAQESTEEERRTVFDSIDQSVESANELSVSESFHALRNLKNISDDESFTDEEREKASSAFDEIFELLDDDVKKRSIIQSIRKARN